MRAGHSPAAYRGLIVMLSALLLVSCLVALAFGPASVPLAHVAGTVSYTHLTLPTKRIV